MIQKSNIDLRGKKRIYQFGIKCFPSIRPDTGEEEVPNRVIPEGAWIRKWVGHNKKIPEAIIRILAKDSSWRVRHTIAMKRKTPPDVRKELSTDTDEGVRHSVAMNAKTPKYILESMLDDPWEEIVLSVKKRLGIHP